MPTWCPKCHAMLADGTQKCPRCGKKLPRASANPGGLSPQEFKAVLLEAYKFALLPVALALLAGLLCLAALYLGK